MKQRRHVAWSCTNELTDVYDWIYSADHVQVSKAVDIIEIWKCRLAQHKIPRSILCTASLAKAQLSNDSQALGMAVMRFVAIASGEEQDRNKYDYALPLHSVAQRVGIPEWMVTMRHDVAHGMFPSLPLLQTACRNALEWLKHNFWIEQIEAYADMSSGKDVMLELEDLMQSYFRVCFECVKNKENYNDTSNQLRPFLNKIEKFLRDSRIRALLTLLTQPGYIIPTSEQCVALGLSASPDNALSPLGDIPVVISDLWFPLFLLFKRLNVLEEFIEFCILSLDSRKIETNCPRQKMLTCWCQAWMKACMKNENGRLRNAVSEKIRCTLDWPKLFSHVVKNNICREFMLLAEQIIELHLPKFSAQQKVRMRTANQLVLGIALPDTSESTLLNSSESDSSEVIDDQIPWDDNNTDWSNFPLGSCPNFSGTRWSSLIL